jgi:hypothetical protein
MDKVQKPSNSDGVGGVNGACLTQEEEKKEVEE